MHEMVQKGVIDSRKRWGMKSDGLDLGCSTGNKCNLHRHLKAEHQQPCAEPARASAGRNLAEVLTQRHLSYLFIKTSP